MIIRTRVDVKMAIHHMAMLKGILSDDLPHLSEPLMENMLTIKTSIDKCKRGRNNKRIKGGGEQCQTM